MAADHPHRKEQQVGDLGSEVAEEDEAEAPPLVDEDGFQTVVSGKKKKKKVKM